MKAPRSKTGDRFGRLTLIGRIKVNGRYSWKWICDCGEQGVSCQTNLRGGLTKSCGCLRRESMGNQFRTHGLTKTPEHIVWMSVKARCFNKNTKTYARYGGRGIGMCRRWENSFSNFLKDMGQKPSPKHSIDRIDTNGPYSPKNCRWATPKEQARNTRKNVFVEILGERLCVAEWCERFSISPQRVHYMFKRGIPREEAILKLKNKN